MVALAVPLSHIEGLSRPGQADLLAIAQAAERGGADQLVLSEHVALGAVIEGHPSTSSGSTPSASAAFPFPATTEYPDPLVALAAVAAVTSTARLSTNILIAPLRPAVLLAKMVSTLDVVSVGRLDLGVGSGWYVPEFDAVGVPLAAPAARLADTVGACRALWQGGPQSFTSATISFADLVCSPTPVQPGGPPVWFGGGPTAGMARRVVTLGHGWTLMGDATPDDVAAGVALLHEECGVVGRDPAELSVRCSLRFAGDLERTLAAATAFVDAGATHLQVPPLRAFVRDVDEVETLVASARAALPH